MGCQNRGAKNRVIVIQKEKRRGSLAWPDAYASETLMRQKKNAIPCSFSFDAIDLGQLFYSKLWQVPTTQFSYDTPVLSSWVLARDGAQTRTVYGCLWCVSNFGQKMYFCIRLDRTSVWDG